MSKQGNGWVSLRLDDETNTAIRALVKGKKFVSHNRALRDLFGLPDFATMQQKPIRSPAKVNCRVIGVDADVWDKLRTHARPFESPGHVLRRLLGLPPPPQRKRKKKAKN